MQVGAVIEVHVLDLSGEQIRIGVKAPKTTPVHREDISDQIQASKKAVSEIDPGDIPG